MEMGHSPYGMAYGYGHLCFQPYLSCTGMAPFNWAIATQAQGVKSSLPFSKPYADGGFE